MEEKKLVPKLRFPGFTEPWEQRKLGEIVSAYSGGTPSASNKEYYGGDIPFIRSAEINNNHTELYITQKGLKDSSAKLVEKGTILYAMYGATSGEVSISQIDGAINQAILAMVPLMYDGEFIAQYLRRQKKNIINKYLQGGQGNLSANIVLNLQIQLPGVDEANQITSFFVKLDNLITLHQRKLEHLKLKKKSLLQKLFPKEGEVYPELRFPGFTAPWEQRKFGELFILKSGVAFKLSEYTKTGIPIINGESIKAGKISLEKVNYLPNEYQYKYQECLLFPGDIVLGLNRPIIDGELKISRIPSDIKTCLLYQRAGKIIFKVNMEENFTYQLLSKEVLTFTRREAVGSDQPFITTTKLNKWNLYLPVKDEERRKIGNLLDNINNIITLHQRKLEHLQLLKKALLQQLFV